MGGALALLSSIVGKITGEGTSSSASTSASKITEKENEVATGSGSGSGCSGCSGGSGDTSGSSGSIRSETNSSHNSSSSHLRLCTGETFSANVCRALCNVTAPTMMYLSLDATAVLDSYRAGQDDDDDLHDSDDLPLRLTVASDALSTILQLHSHPCVARRVGAEQLNGPLSAGVGVMQLDNTAAALVSALQHLLPLCSYSHSHRGGDVNPTGSDANTGKVYIMDQNMDQNQNQAKLLLGRVLQILQRVIATGGPVAGKSWSVKHRRTFLGALLRVLMGPVPVDVAVPEDAPVDTNSSRSRSRLLSGSLCDTLILARAAEMLQTLVLDPVVEKDVRGLLKAYYGSETDRVLLGALGERKGEGDGDGDGDGDGLTDTVAAVNAVLLRTDQSF